MNKNTAVYCVCSLYIIGKESRVYIIYYCFFLHINETRKSRA